MKVSAFAVVGIASLASALPLRIIVISSSVTTTGRIPDHAIATSPGGRPMFAHVPSSPFTPIAAASTTHKMGCGRRVQSQFLQMSNRLRAALGLPPIITSSSSSSSPHVSLPPPRGEFHILPFVPGERMPMPDRMNVVARVEEGSPMPMPMPFMHMPMAHHAHGRHGDGEDAAPFVYRLHRAMNHLGPWEGRAIAFVLGCGMGVLIRMLFVFTVLLWRARRCSLSTFATTEADDEDEEEADEQTHFLPPRYSSDEKRTLILSAPAPEYTVNPDAEVKEETHTESS